MEKKKKMLSGERRRLGELTSREKTAPKIFQQKLNKQTIVFDFSGIFSKNYLFGFLFGHDKKIPNNLATFPAFIFSFMETF